MKEGAINKKLVFGKLLIYASSVYHITQKIKGMMGKRHGKQ